MDLIFMFLWFLLIHISMFYVHAYCLSRSEEVVQHPEVEL